MPKKVTAKLGIERQIKDVELDIPDNEPAPWDADDRLTVVNQPLPRVDALAKVTGRAKYTYDVKPSGLLYGKILRAPHPAAVVKRIDTSRAAAFPGVKAIHLIADPGDPVKSAIKFAGQEVVAVAAESPEVAEDAIRLIAVEYETKPFVVDTDKARQSDAPLVHAQQVQERRSEGDAPAARGARITQHGNVRTQTRETGNVEQGFAQAEVVVEATYRTQVQTHCCLETHGAVAQWDGDQLTVWTSTQGTFSVRDDLARHFNMPATKVRVITEHMGGGFGSKFGIRAFEPATAELARKAGAPVKLMLDRQEEHLATGNRPDSVQTIKLGAKRDGTLTAIHLISYGTAGIGTGAGTAGPAENIYNCPNKRFEESDVFTNAGPGAPFRAPGHPQGCFALEQTMDELAEKLGMDPIELRKKNDPSEIRQAEFKLGAEAMGWQRRNAKPGAGTGPVKRGIGVASGVWYKIYNPNTQVIVEILADGSITALNGAQDVGTGTRTIIGQVVAEELGVRLEDVTVKLGDTQWPMGPGSGGSSTAPSLMPAARVAAYAAKQKLFEAAAPLLNTQSDQLETKGRRIFVKGDPAHSASWERVVESLGGKITVQGQRSRDYNGYEDRRSHGVQFAEVEVDTETGAVRVIKVVAVHDCGLPVNRLTAESQINGGVIQGISYALHENRVIDQQKGYMVNPNFMDYKISGSLDIPEIVPIIVPVYAGFNATSTVGLGEPPTVPTAAAIANAIYNAIGVRLRALPMTPDKILAALAEKGGAA